MSPTPLIVDGPKPTSLPLPFDASLPLALSARVANIVYTAQVQMAYACADDARQSAERSIANIEGSWMAPPVRQLLLNVYRSQADAAAHLAEQVLANARQRCGLAYAPVGCTGR
jgi:hypothetical protein